MLILCLLMWAAASSVEAVNSARAAGRLGPVQLAATSELDWPIEAADFAASNPASFLRPVGATQHRDLCPGSFLPPPTARLISGRCRVVLSFVLAYLANTPGLEDVSVMISGGYVRDILLGRNSDDLDLTLDLRRTSTDVSVDAIAEGLPAFAARLGGDVEAVEVVTAMSDASRHKDVDAAQVVLQIQGEEVLVDLMPTIAREVYDAHDRIPRREGRGTPHQDSLRRDLTIGAMLLEVVPPEAEEWPQEEMVEADDVSVAEQLLRSVRASLLREHADSPLSAAFGIRAAAAARGDTALGGCACAPPDALRFRLLDYHGGLADLHAGVLRAPYPRDRPLDDVWAALSLGDDERDQCEQLVIRAVGAEGDAEGDSEALFTALTQELWWIKSLRDDPLRIVRTLRFAATLQFQVHDSFWHAVPFATDALRHKVSGPRKLAELRKIAKAGIAPLLGFFDLAFSPLAAFGEAVAFGDALFGGPPPEGEDAPERISVTVGFDAQTMHSLASTLPEALCADARLGAVLAAATISCDLRRNGPCGIGFGDSDLADECLLAGPPQHLGYAADDAGAHNWQMGACLEISLDEVVRACAGLQASQPMQHAAEAPLRLASSLLRPPRPQQQHELLASATLESGTSGAGGLCALGGGGSVDAVEIAALLQMWELLQLDPSQTTRRLDVGADFVLALLRTRCAACTTRQFEARLAVLRSHGPQISGRAVAEVEGVPPHLRGTLIAQLNVLCRLRGEAPVLDTAEAVSTYLEEACGGLLDQLREEWYGEPGGGLRECYSKRASSEWLRSGHIV